MRTLALSLLAAAALVGLAEQASAGGRNPDGYGLYTPSYRLPDGRRVYRHDLRSWYYAERGYYPHFDSGYWVPRAEMRNRFRYKYLGPRYRYAPAWGYR